MKAVCIVLELRPVRAVSSFGWGSVNGHARVAYQIKILNIYIEVSLRNIKAVPLFQISIRS